MMTHGTITYAPRSPTLEYMDVKKEVDLIALANDGRHYAERREGVVRIIDSLTGKIIAVQSEYAPAHPGDYSEILLPTGDVVLAQRGLEKFALDARLHADLQPYLIDVICQKVAEGQSLMAICKEPGFPSYNTLAKWRRKHDWVSTALHEARTDRAEYLRDKAVQEAENAENPKDSIDGTKLRVDTYKWAAGVDDSKFSPRSKVEATINAPTQLIIVTGIDRKEDPPETLARDVSQKIKSGENNG